MITPLLFILFIKLLMLLLMLLMLLLLFVGSMPGSRMRDSPMTAVAAARIGDVDDKDDCIITPSPPIPPDGRST
jgi:hypothetical protein